MATDRNTTNVPSQTPTWITDLEDVVFTHPVTGVRSVVVQNDAVELLTKASAITTPATQGSSYVQADVATLKTAIDAIRAALIAAGITS